MKTASEALKHGNGTSYPMSIPEAITDSSHELWLLRVPRHSVLRECLVGKEIVVDDQTVQNSVRGNYAFRDASLTPAAQRIRPVVVGAESGGDMQLILGQLLLMHSQCRRLCSLSSGADRTTLFFCLLLRLI